MSERDDRPTGDPAPHGRDGDLTAALLRIGASLDLETVLREVVESARALTGARCGSIATVDKTGTPQDFVTSGVTEAEHRRLVEWPDGPRLFEHVRDLQGPLRLKDLSVFLRSHGLATGLIPWKTLQGMPMRHHGVHVGNFYLVEKQGGGAFTDEDEKVLVVFAAQAAAAIAHARSYRAERRARADLEALVETSPVGVLVFDAATGRPVSMNGEAKRILEALRIPGRRLEELMGVVICRFAERRDVALQDCPITRALTLAETMRNEELVLSVPDGRSVKTLTNITPISAEDGAVTSLVVTLQDLAPLEEIERQRAAFLGMVSHELRAPLAAIKGSAATVLGRARRFGAAELEQFFRIIEAQADRMDALIGDLLDAGRIETGTLSVAPEPSEVADLADRARATFLSGGGSQRVVVDLPVELPRVMADRERIGQVLDNLLGNAARHSPTSAPIRIEAVREGAHVAVSVADEGRGLAPEALSRLFRKYAPEGEEGGGVGGGLGLAICKGLVEAHGGRIRAESGGPGRGARFTFTLPAADPGAASPLVSPAPLRPEQAERPRILALDDDPETLRVVRDALSQAGYATVVTGDHEGLSDILRREKPALVLLDLMLPGTDGIELMREVPELADVPVVFISGYGRDETVARALEAGAEDYIVKPFSPTELVARVRAALRRRADPEPFVLGALAIDYDRRRATLAGRALELTATEFDLLRALSLEAGRVVTYETLMRRVWGGRKGADEKSVRAYVQRLRAKLGDDAKQPTYIVTELRVGYRMPGPEEA